MRYLNHTQSLEALRSGRPIEQFLLPREEPTYRMLRFLRIDKERTGKYSTAFFEVFDEGDENNLDLYSFGLIDPDLPYGAITTFSTPEEAINFSIETLQADPDKFVNQGVIQDEYGDFLKK